MDQDMTTRKALTVIAIVGCLILLTFIVPSNWVGIRSTKGKALTLLDPSQLQSLAGDQDKNDNPDWKDLLLEETSSSTVNALKDVTISPEDKARLNDPNNLTASFSKNIYTATAYAKKNGGLTKDKQDQLIKSLLAKETSKIVVKSYLVSDLVIASSTPAAEKAYGNALGNILKEANSYNLGQSDIAIINAYAINKDPAPLASLTVKKNNLDKIINELLLIPVPFSAVPQHLLLLNRVSAYRTTIDNMSQAETDPLRATIGFNDYITVYKLVLSAIGSLQDYFKVENIQFGKNDPGYTFVYGYTN